MKRESTNEVFSPERLGEYTIIRDIAEGTFGIVKLARHTITGQMVAMKFISKALINRTKTKTRVQREVEYMKTLRHPHIIKLYDVISTPTDIIIVLEYAGGELFRYIVENGRMPEPRARRFFQQLISGIEYSHKLKIVHRDLKPENVLLDDGLNVKIADFGLSNEIKDGDFLKTSCGSPNYAAPEVIRGALYTGPEIDVWSCGVILYVMLTGSLPFEDENVKVLFEKITQGVYHPPQDVSRDALSLIESMLVVDPVKRITISEITQHPFFIKDLPRYLTPLPPPPGPVLPTLSALVAPPKALDFEIIDGLGRIEEDVVEELSGKLENTGLEDVWEALRREDGGNAVKVAYLLLRDKHRLGRDLSEFEEQERDAQLAALDPRNAVSPGALSPGAGDMESNPFESEFNEQYANGEEDSLSSPTESTLSDGEDQPVTPFDPNVSNFSVLNSSLPGQLPEPHHLANYVKARAGREREREKKMHRTKWHFGIRSRSPSMEVMLEIYRTLQALGMEWKEKGNLGGLGHGALGMGLNGSVAGKGGEIRRAKEHDGYGEIDLKAAASIYFIETRGRVGDVVVLMNIQLYTVDSSNYLVDFHHKKTYKASTAPGAGKYDMAYPRPIEDYLESSSPITASSSVVSVASAGRPIKAHGDVPGVGAKEEDVVSPFVFMDVANRLILELAGGGQ